MKSNKAVPAGRQGFSLIEAVIVLFLVAVLTFGLGSFIFETIQAWLSVSGRNSATNKASMAMNRITREIRRVKKPQNIQVFTSSEFQFVDIDSQTVDFKQTGSDLLRNGDVLASGLLSPIGLEFTYLDRNGSVAGAKQDIRSVRIWLSLVSGNQLTTLESSSRIRNL